MTGSVAFDRAASFYDQTRTLSPETARKVTDLLVSELKGRGRCLEIGVGTGRIAIPVAEAGVPLVGVDLARPMLDRLIEKAGGRPPFPVALADATRLPFAAGSFDTAFAVHVLHLIPAWRDAIGELVRVVGPGGRVLIDVGTPSNDPLEEVTDRFAREAGVDRRHPGLGEDGAEELDEAVGSFGATVRVLPEIVELRRLPIDGWIQLLQGNVFSWTWPIDDDTRHRAAEAVREWAAERYDDISSPQEVRHVIEWRAYDLP